MNQYPSGPGFQAHSETSREAAERLTTGQKNREIAFGLIDGRGSKGATIDEVSQHLGVPPNEVSGRFIELERAGRITKTPIKRKTRSGRAAFVYMAWSSWAANLPPAPVCPPPARKSALAEFERVQAINGHGHVVPRSDGKKTCSGVSYCKICKQAESYKKYLQDRENRGDEQ